MHGILFHVCLMTGYRQYANRQPKLMIDFAGFYFSSLLDDTFLHAIFTFSVLTVFGSFVSFWICGRVSDLAASGYLIFFYVIFLPIFRVSVFVYDFHLLFRMILCCSHLVRSVIEGRLFEWLFG